VPSILDERLTIDGYLERKVEGWTDKEIASDFWVSRETLRDWKKRHGLGRVGRLPSVQRKEDGDLKLAEAVEKRKSYLINQLYFYGYDKTELESLTLSELEAEHIKAKCEVGREISKIQTEER